MSNQIMQDHKRRLLVAKYDKKRTRDVSAYIPTNVISITDGQIFLEIEPSNVEVDRLLTWDYL